MGFVELSIYGCYGINMVSSNPTLSAKTKEQGEKPYRIGFLPLFFLVFLHNRACRFWYDLSQNGIGKTVCEIKNANEKMPMKLFLRLHRGVFLCAFFVVEER